MPVQPGCITMKLKLWMPYQKAEWEGKLRSATKDSSFISKGFVNWKDSTKAFKRFIYV